MVFVCKPATDVVDDVARTEARNKSRPARANALGAVDEDHRDGWLVERWLNFHAFLLNLRQQSIIIFREDDPAQRIEVSEDVPGTGGLFSAHETCAKLTDRKK